MSLDPRAIKAMTLVADGIGSTRTSDGSRLVPSQSKPGAFYIVSADSCTCADSQYRPSKVCKHRLALRIQRTIDEATDNESRFAVVA